MKGMILAAGLGERLLPLSAQLPKPLFPVVNIPLIRYTIELLKRYGVDDLVINLFHLGRAIEQELADGAALGVRIRYSHERELWGTGGGLKQMESFFAREECFVLANADTLVDVDLEAALHFHRRHAAAATMLVTTSASTRVYGAVELDESGAVRNIAGRIPDVRESERTPTVFCGVHILTPKIFEYIPPNINSCINAYAYPKMIQNGERVMGYEIDGTFIDLGRPETYYAANMAYLQRKLKLRHFDPLAQFTLKTEKERGELACLGENVELGSEITFLAPFVVGHNVRIGDKATIGPYAIIGDGSQIGRQAAVSESILFAGTKVGQKQKLQGLLMTNEHKLRLPPQASNTRILPADDGE